MGAVAASSLAWAGLVTKVLTRLHTAHSGSTRAHRVLWMTRFTKRLLNQCAAKLFIAQALPVQAAP